MSRPTLADRIVSARVPLLVVALLLLIASGAAILTLLRIDFTPQRIFESRDVEFGYLADIQRTFGHDDDVILLHVQAPEGILSEEGVALLARLRAALEAIPELERVDDLTTAWTVRPGVGPGLLIPPRAGSRSPADWAAVSSQAQGDPLLAGRLLSRAGTSALVVAHVEEGRERYDDLRVPVERVIALSESIERPPGVEILATGVPVARVQIAARLMADQLTYFPLCGALFVGLLWLIFRDLRAVILPLLAVALAITYTTGLLAVSGQGIDIINNVLPVLIFVIGISDAIHLLVRYRHELEEGRPQREALRITVRHLLVACFLTSFTTAVGFGSLAAARIEILKRFGLSAAVGVLIAYLVVVLLVPAALSMLSPALPEASRAADRRVQALSVALGRWVLARRFWVLGVSALILVLAAALASRVHEENHVYEAFPSDAPLVVANGRLERDFAGIVPISVVVTWAEGRSPLEPETLAYLAELQAALAAEDFPPLSVLDLLSEARFARAQGAPGSRRLPESRAEANQLWGLLQLGLEQAGRGEELLRLIRPEERILRITARAKDVGATRLNASFERIDALIAAGAARQERLGLRVRLSGGGPVASRGVNVLILDLFYSLLLAFLVILPTMCVLLRSVWAGLVSMIPNVTPLLMTLGFMGLVGMDLRVTSVIVFSVSLGLAVDDTIHFMARFRAEWAALCAGPERPAPGDAAALDLAYQAALLRTYRGTGGAIVTTTVLLAAGYSVLLASGFPITRVFGLCMEVTVLAALAADLFLLPACLLVLKPFPLAPALPAAAPGAEV